MGIQAVVCGYFKCPGTDEIEPDDCISPQVQGLDVILACAIENRVCSVHISAHGNENRSRALLLGRQV